MRNDTDQTIDAPSFVEPESSAQSNSLSELNLPYQFGKYRLLEKVGSGGMGVVYRSAHADGSQCAVKLLRNELFADAHKIKRFQKEAILHAEIESEFVVAQREFGEHENRLFIASEFIQGNSLWEISARIHRLGPRAAAVVIRDVLRGLAAMHSNSMLHRDVKPSNILIRFKQSANGSNFNLDDIEIAKLTDLGLARYVNQTKSLELTQTRTIMGTPMYMAPEQYTGTRSVQKTADVYSVGCTLYMLLAGHPPFRADDSLQLIEMHRSEQPVPVSRLNPKVAPALNHIVSKAIEKVPSLRYQDAGEMLSDVQAWLDETPIRFAPFPRVSTAKQKCYSYSWELDCTPAQLWPFVSETDRFNRAIGLPAPTFSFEGDGQNRKTIATANFNGLNVRWREHPFQWIVYRRMSVLREFETGPFRWVTSTVYLEPLTGKRTRLVHEFQVESRGFLGWLVTPIQFGIMTKKQLNRVYAQIETLAKDTHPASCDAALGNKPKISQPALQKLAQTANQMIAGGSNREMVGLLFDYLKTSSDSSVAKIRPLDLAHKLALDPDEFLSVCLSARQYEVLQSSWDIICPVCRIAAGGVQALDLVTEHHRCEACNQQFETNFGSSIELVFSVHPTIRSPDHRTYCIGGPFHSPHVVAQLQFDENESQSFGIELGQGPHELCSPQVDHQITAEVDESASTSELHLNFRQNEICDDIRPGSVACHIQNGYPKKIALRLERATDETNAATLFQIREHSEFARHFQHELDQIDDLSISTFAYVFAIKISDFESLVSQVGETKANYIWSDLLLKLYQTNIKFFIAERTFDCLIIACEFPNQKFVDLVSNSIEFMQNLRPFATPFVAIVTAGDLKLAGPSNSRRYFGKAIRELISLTEESDLPANLLVTSNSTLDDTTQTWLDANEFLTLKD